MSNLFLTNTDMAGVTPSGAEVVRHKLNGSAGAASTLRNKNTVAGPTVPLEVTSSVTAGTDGSTMAWYSEQLQPVTIAGQIVASVWGRQSTSATANCAPCIGVYRCDANGAELATIVDPAGPSQGALEFTNTAGGATKTCTITAANVVDTNILDGERLKVSLFIDDASGQGGSGSMASGQNCQFWVNGPTGAAGQSQIAFTETILSLVQVSVARQPHVNRRAAQRAAIW
jgi:hypothetical protein